MEVRLESILSGFRAAKRPCALMMMDLDKFKQVNDTLGHPAGDELLRQVAQRLQRIVPPPAEIGRLGGDEFKIIVPDVDDRGKLGEIATKIIQMLSQPYSLGEDRAVIGASVGIAIAPFDGDTPEELEKSADLALYASKQGGAGASIASTPMTWPTPRGASAPWARTCARRWHRKASMSLTSRSSAQRTTTSPASRRGCIGSMTRSAWSRARCW